MRHVVAVPIVSAGAPAAAGPKSAWQSPVPYLFGGVAAMLALIAFALLILACSYWRLSARRPEDSDQDKDKDLENGPDKVYEEKFLVIMAGHHTPTFLAVCNTLASVDKCKCLHHAPQQPDKTVDDDKTKSSENEIEPDRSQPQHNNNDNNNMNQ